VNDAGGDRGIQTEIVGMQNDSQTRTPVRWNVGRRRPSPGP